MNQAAGKLPKEVRQRFEDRFLTPITKENMLSSSYPVFRKEVQGRIPYEFMDFLAKELSQSRSEAVEKGAREALAQVKSKLTYESFQVLGDISLETINDVIENISNKLTTKGEHEE